MRSTLVGLSRSQPNCACGGPPAASFTRRSKAASGVTIKNGHRLHPQYVLNRFHARSRKAGAPKIALHDLRHLTAT